MPAPLRNEYLGFLNRELHLTPEQRQTISSAVHQSQERVSIMYELIAPDVREELRLTREEIRSHLNPEQRRRFEELPKKFPRRPDERERLAPDRRPGRPEFRPPPEGDHPPPL